jgi:predicted nicotinamide N-methyase
MNSPAAPPHSVWHNLGLTIHDKVIVEDRTFVIARPSQSDKIVSHPDVRESFERDGRLPYWADLWPGSRMLAKVIVRESWPARQHALELGCGLGLPGLAALSAGLRVTFSDYDACALRFAADNARLNGFENFETLLFDWRQPPDLRVPILLASDLVYELRNVEPLVHCIKTVLDPAGVCLLTDQDRVPAHAMREALTREGLTFTTQIARAGEPGGRRLKGTLYRITKS